MNTMQQEFDAVVTHLFKQGRQARFDGGCAYRGEGGLMCAVGCRIPESMYQDRMEGESVTTLLDSGFALPEEVAAYQPMFQSLQYVHDSSFNLLEDGTYDKRGLETELRKVAERFGLKFTLPQ